MAEPTFETLILFMESIFGCHSREGGNPFQASAQADEWSPGFAGMTIKTDTAHVKVVSMSTCTTQDSLKTYHAKSIT
jgi:hypothetical protein